MPNDQRVDTQANPDHMRQLVKEIGDALCNIKTGRNITSRDLELRDEAGRKRGLGRQTITNLASPHKRRYYKVKGIDEKVVRQLEIVAHQFRDGALRMAIERYRDAKTRGLFTPDTTASRKKKCMV